MDPVDGAVDNGVTTSLDPGDEVSSVDVDDCGVTVVMVSVDDETSEVVEDCIEPDTMGVTWFDVTTGVVIVVLSAHGP